MPQIKRQVEQKDGQSYLVLYVKSDEYGVIEPDQFGPAVDLLIGQTPRKMTDAEVAEALRSTAQSRDIPL